MTPSKRFFFRNFKKASKVFLVRKIRKYLIRGKLESSPKMFVLDTFFSTSVLTILKQSANLKTDQMRNGGTYEAYIKNLGGWLSIMFSWHLRLLLCFRISIRIPRNSYKMS